MDKNTRTDLRYPIYSYFQTKPHALLSYIQPGSSQWHRLIGHMACETNHAARGNPSAKGTLEKIRL